MLIFASVNKKSHINYQETNSDVTHKQFYFLVFQEKDVPNRTIQVQPNKDSGSTA